MDAEAPETHYAKAGDLNIAYQVIGSGPPDLLYVGSFVNQIEHAWELPSYARFLQRLASFSRLITLDKRGAGLSDRVASFPPLDERMDDLRVVLDAAGSERAVLFGSSEGGVLSAVFAATFPERTAALVMHGSGAGFSRESGLESGWGKEFRRRFFDYLESGWGSGEAAAIPAPSCAGDERFKRWYAKLERLTGTPGAIRAMIEWNMAIDIREVLPVIDVPTLILHRVDEQLVPVAAGRYLAKSIRGAKYVELPGGDHYPYVGDIDEVLDEIEEFVTGVRRSREPDRVLATVMFTDIVDSTRKATKLGDRRWRELLEAHDALVRRQLERFSGREVKTMGDGFLSVFDGPARAIRCASALTTAVDALGIQIRAGLHTGECERRNGDISGMAVHIGARVASLARPGEVLVSGTVKDLVVGSNIEFADRGTQTLKGVPGQWRLYAVEV
jgi:class 3 adenylate cyclase